MASRYWVGGTADWDNNIGTKWAATSGGGGGVSIPTASDDVFFDAASGAVTVTITNQIARCKNFVATGFTGTLAGVTFALNVSGSVFTLGSGMTYTQTPTVFDAASGAVTLTPNGVSTGTITFGGGGAYVLASALIVASNRSLSFAFTNGSFNASNFNVTAGRIEDDSVTGTSTITMGSGTWTVNGAGSLGGFRLGTVATLTANTSTVKITSATAAIDLTFYGKTFYNVWISRGSNTDDITINGNGTGNPTFNTFKDDGTGTHSIKFLNGQTYTFSASGPTAFVVNGNSGHLISIDSDTTGTHTLSCATGVVNASYVSIQHSIATGGASWNADSNSTNNQAVPTAGSGWIFHPIASTLAIGQGSYALSGQVASFIKSRKAVLAVGLYTLTGFALAFLSKWNNVTKNVSSWLNGAKNSLSSMTNQSKNSSNWSNQTKH